MNTLFLPEGYAERCRIDLQKNKKLALGVNLGALAIAAVLVAIGLVLVPFSALISYDSDAELSDLIGTCLRLLVMCVGIVLYLVLHELTHGVFMRHYGGVKPRYGLTPLYAYCGSDAYFDRPSYLVIGLSPVIIWGCILLAACFCVPTEWFWVAYIIQIVNLSGAAGDIYVTWKILRLPKDILVQDTGTAMTIYAREA